MKLLKLILFLLPLSTYAVNQDCVPATLERLAKLNGYLISENTWIEKCKTDLNEGTEPEQIALAWGSLIKDKKLRCIYAPIIETNDNSDLAKKIKSITDSLGGVYEQDLIEGKIYLWLGIYIGNGVNGAHCALLRVKDENTFILSHSQKDGNKYFEETFDNKYLFLHTLAIIEVK